MEGIIRRMCPEDLDQVLKIQEKLQFQNWKREHFLAEIGESFFSVPLVIQFDTVVGYVVLKIAVDEAELCSIAVGAEFQGQGLARKLLEQAGAILRSKGVLKIFLEVRKGNFRAQQVYRAYGFTNVGSRRNYYPDGEDAMVMECALRE